MEIILKETIDTLGREGEVVKVKPGYARNFLIPQQKAVMVTKEALTRLEKEKQAIEKRLEGEQKGAEKLKGQLESKAVAIARRVGDEERLFGSVTTTDIAEALKDAGINIDRRAIVLADPLKALGEYKVAIKVGYQMTADINVQVVPETLGDA